MICLYIHNFKNLANSHLALCSLSQIFLNYEILLFVPEI